MESNLRDAATDRLHRSLQDQILTVRLRMERMSRDYDGKLCDGER